MDSMDGPDKVLVVETAATASSVPPGEPSDVVRRSSAAMDAVDKRLDTQETDAANVGGGCYGRARRRLEAERATATAPQDQGSVAVAEYEETKDENAKDVTETNKATDDDGTGTRGGSLNGGVYGSTCRLSKENVPRRAMAS
ncbi:hypothetical protein GN244_ATG15624 [Phytophthora infestans]|uniref:Uncharacterized protein n=1 Tax=Phytophthora infestans TaxID=4787 RepID=A0A833SUW7_PHYIN|nr:hypothetical protein GN244_ATG15622 [Phytophthora infestans]KAF4032462.1 hypothetical protein GN244_ATG15624 [Phytophthora infestans]